MADKLHTEYLHTYIYRLHYRVSHRDNSRLFLSNIRVVRKSINNLISFTQRRANVLLREKLRACVNTYESCRAPNNVGSLH